MSAAKKIALLLLITLLPSCVSQRIGSLAQLPLPMAKEQPCCWQTLQQWDIKTDQEEMSLQAVLARNNTDAKQTLTLVLLDPMGRRLLSVSDESGHIQSLPDTAQQSIQTQGEFLMAAIYLAYWPRSSWHSALANSDWSLHESKHGTQLTRTLYHAQQRVLTLKISSAGGPEVDQTVQIEHHLKIFTASITTRQRQNF